MWTIRQATIDDVDTLTELRRRFLDEIGYGGNGVAKAVRDYFLEAIPRDEFKAWGHVARYGEDAVRLSR